MARHTFEIVVNDRLGDLPDNLTRAEKIELMRNTYRPPKERIAAFILEQDPEAEVGSLDLFFPIFAVTMLDAVAFQLRTHPDVDIIKYESVFVLAGDRSLSEQKKREDTK